MSEQQIEQAIQAKGLNAPRITPDHIDGCIVKEQYHVFDGTTVTRERRKAPSFRHRYLHNYEVVLD